MWSLAVFFVYGGFMAGAGIWAFAYLTEELGISNGISGLVVGAYWGGLTTSRLLLGAVGDRFQPDTLLRWSVVSTAVAFVFLWWSPTTLLAAAALIFAGFAHGPFFPLQVLLTPRRVGNALTSRVVGYEIATANVGGALLPSLIGLAVGFGDLSVIPPILVVNALVLIAVVEMLRRQSANAASADHSQAAMVQHDGGTGQ
jgi:fucose permease